MAEKMITVWITEHDDEEVGYVVNEREDMRENFDDLLDGEIDGGLSFEEYLGTWIELEMPYHIFTEDDYAVRNEWIESELELLR